MKNAIKTLVLIWLSSVTVPVFAGDVFVKNSSNGKMYIARDDEDVAESNAQLRIGSGVDATEKEPVVKESLSRVRRVYIGFSAGYFYTKDDMSFKDIKQCTGTYQDPFFCVNGKENPITVDYDGDYFLSASFGINSDSMLRLEFSYFYLGRNIDMLGINQVNGLTQRYSSSLGIEGGAVNVYVDFVGDRKMHHLLFVPYVMAGIGVAQVDLGDIKFAALDSTSHYVPGNRQGNRVVIYGAGFTSGLNNYAALDIGYRMYDFGKVQTQIGLDSNILKDVGLETKLKAHVATVGLRLQM